MRTAVDVRLIPSGHWKPGVLTTAHPDKRFCGQVVVIVEGVCLPRSYVQSVLVHDDCPIALFDAAVEAGYFVRGGPARRASR